MKTKSQISLVKGRFKYNYFHRIANGKQNIIFTKNLNKVYWSL